MKRQYLGNSKDSFKWDYHDYLTRELGCSTLNVVLMMTKDDESPGHGKSPPGNYPASDKVLELCRDLRNQRNPAMLRCLPKRTGAEYSVELYKAGCHFPEPGRRDYFEGLRGGKKQVVLVDPDVGFEPPKSCSEKHVRFDEVERIVQRISSGAVVSIFQDLIRKSAGRQWRRVKDELNDFPLTCIYWKGKMMFVLLSQSEDRIRKVREINRKYRESVLSRCPGFKEKLQLCE